MSFSALLALVAIAGRPQRPTFTYLTGGARPVVSDAQRRRETGANNLPGYGFEGGRTVRLANGSTYLFTAEFQGWPINANMRLALWRANGSGAAGVSGGWSRLGTVANASSAGNGTSLASWNRTCSQADLAASPWAPFPVFDEAGDRWHVHWVSYACDLDWVVRVGVGNIRGARSATAGVAGIGGPYVPYAGNGVVIGPNASGGAPNATRWGDLSDCAPCHAAAAAKPPRAPPVYCSTPPCQFDNGITGAAICSGPYALPPPPAGAAAGGARFAAFLGLDHDLAWAPSMAGPWTVGSAGSTGQQMMAKVSTPSSMYTENPVVSRIKRPDGGVGFVAVFDTVSPSGGWVRTSSAAGGGGWESGAAADRGEAYGFGVMYSADGRYWSGGEDVALPGGCRTPLGLMQEPDGSFSLLFTRRFADCANQTLEVGSRGDACNGRSMCANLYAARFSVSWGDW